MRRANVSGEKNVLKCIRICSLALATTLLLALPASAQFQISRSVLGSGGSLTSGPNNSIDGTLGQVAIGIVSGANYWHHIGFWSGPPFPTAVDELPGMPSSYELMQNHPNPFNPKTTVRYAVPEAVRVTIKIYDIRGREQATLLDADHEAGYHDFDYDAVNLTSGVYFYRMQAGRYAETRKLVLLK